MITLQLTAFGSLMTSNVTSLEKGHKTIKTRKMKQFNEESFLSDVSGYVGN